MPSSAGEASANNADELSPSEFLKSIQNLGARKDAEDAERLAALEKEIELGRKEREMRRAERARSISPEKSSTPRLERDSTSSSPRARDSTSSTPRMDESTTPASTSPTTSATPQTASQLARSGTLSWQQRPKSRGGDGRRPLSWLAQENAARSPRDTPERARSPTKSTPETSNNGTPERASDTDKEPSRAQIADSLGARDPSWFRQTPDRGIGSAAYRRNQDEDAESASGGSAGRMKLPGMSRQSPAEVESPTSPPPESTRSNSPSRTNSVRDSTFSSNRFSNTTAGTEFGSTRMKSPPSSILDAPKLEPSATERKSPMGARPASPTKGMGGFVESAMLKRADSVSKRWSQQSGAGLARSGSAASNRNSYLGGYGGSVPVTDRASPPVSSRDTSLEPSSRPTSSHSNLTVTQDKPAATTKDADGFVKPSLPDRSHSRSKSVASLRSVNNDASGEPGSPASPTKRWSPTKSSWLESSLLKEDKPKVMAQAPPAQPSWMVEINKAKQQRANSPTKELASPVAAESKAAPFGRESLKAAKKDAPVSPPLAEVSKPERTPSLKSTSTAPAEPSKAKSPSPEVAAKPVSIIKDKPAVAPKPSTPSPTASRTNSFDATKPGTPSAASPGKFDFRGTLKSRAAPSDASKANEPEFKNLLGNLKRTKTQNYVAPDLLKDNITRGKAGLNITGGVPERKRVDELKEQLNKQKAAIKARAEAGDVPVRPQKPAEIAQTPEALARRKTLSRSGSEGEGVRRTEREETPEALAAMRSVRAQAKPIVVGAKPAVVAKSPPPVAEKRISQVSVASRASVASRSSVSEKLEKAAEEKSAEEVKPAAKPWEKPVQKPAEKPAEKPWTKPIEKPAEKPIEKPAETQPSKPSAQPFGLPGMVKPGVSSKLADRFNPALANMLARGPPGSGSTSKNASPGDSPALSRTTTQDDKPSAGPDLEHKTKGRARGPKRRAKGKAADVVEDEAKVEEVKEEPVVAEAKTEVAPVVSKPAIASIASKPSIVSVASKPAIVSIASKPAITPAVSKPAVAPEASKPAVTPPVSKPAVTTPSKHARIPSAQLVRNKDVLRSSPTPSSASKPVDSRPESLDSPLGKPKPQTPSKSERFSTSDVKPEPVRDSFKGSPTPNRLPLREHQGNGPALKPVEPPSPTKTRALPTPPTELKVETPKKAVIGALFEQRFQATPPSRSGNNSPTPATEDSIAPMSVRDSTALFARQESPGPFSSGKKSPIKLPTKQDEERAMRDAGLMPPPQEAPVQAQKPSTSGLGISSVATASPALVEIPGSGRKSPLSPPLNVRPSPVNGNATLKTPIESPKPQAPAESPIPHTSEATRLFGNFFDERPVAARPESVDTLSILESTPLPTEKVTTIKKQLQEITNDGKLTPVAQHQEHMLFDQSMYVCTHVFSNSKGVRSTEVYLWAGSDVSPASLEDAQLFGRRVAKDNGGKLVVIQQGQETPNFLQALGGILITFRGAKSRSSIGVPPQFILCGRRHLGHVVFDEVDFTLHSFCSGFPYLISTNNRLYLWKGIGCHQEELSSARLITMDVSPMPDLVEIEEGKEPASFFSLFPPLPKYPKNTIPRSADHWRLRPRHDNYTARLFRIEQVRQKSMSLQVSSFLSNVIKRRPSWSSFGANTSSPSTPTAETPTTSTTITSTTSTTALGEPSPTTSEQPRTPLSATPTGTLTTKIVEVAPFGQADLKADAVFVLDAFFEVYVIIGPLAQSQSHAFATALHFAQDYGIIAASMQDRPFVPVSTVVLEGAPRDMKFCFRIWDNERGVGGTEALMAGGLKRAGSLRCVGLSAALASLRVDS